MERGEIWNMERCRERRRQWEEEMIKIEDGWSSRWKI